MQEARSKFSVDIEPENAVTIDPSDGYLTPEGSATLHFRRSSPSASTGRISCKVNDTFSSSAQLVRSQLSETILSQIRVSINLHCTLFRFTTVKKTKSVSTNPFYSNSLFKNKHQTPPNLKSLLHTQ